MAKPRRDKGIVGVDSNVLLAYFADDYPQHREVKWLADAVHVVSPTVIHETYHVLVFKRKWDAHETTKILSDYVSDMEQVLLVSQNRRTVMLGLSLASKFTLGGRDALIISSLILSNTNVSSLVTFDSKLLELASVKYRNKIMNIERP